MANTITISTLGPAAFDPHPTPYGQEAVDAMIAHWRRQIDQVLPDQPDLIVVPEACDRFPAHSMQERLDYYRARGVQVRDFFATVAAEHHCTIAYSGIRGMDDGTWRNSTQLIDRDGIVSGVYDKVHPTIDEIDEAGILCGRGPVVVDCDFGRVGIAICFDLNFRDLLDAYEKERPDVIVFSSMYHGGLRQSWWACQTQAHFVGAICGKQSSILSPVGQVLATSTDYRNYATASVNLDCRVVHLDYNQTRLEKLKQAYGPDVEIHDPGHLGCVLLSSRSEAVSVEQMIEEFGIELWDDYHARALDHHRNPKNIGP